MMDQVEIGAGEALKVLSAGAVRASLVAAATAYNAATGCAFAFSFDTAGGVEKRTASETPDIFASSMDSLRAIAALGALAGQPRAVGSARIALGMRTGEQAPDISDVEALRSALRGARKIALGDPAGGGTAARHLAEMFARLGVTAEVAAKSVLRVGGVNVMKAVASGLADFGVTQSTEITPVEGVEIGGWLPEELQLTTVYGVAPGAQAAQPDKAHAFVRWLASPDGSSHFTAAGFFPA